MFMPKTNSQALSLSLPVQTLLLSVSVSVFVLTKGADVLLFAG